MNIKDSVVVVTGCTSGLGRVTASQLVDKGAHVFGLARRAERLREMTTQSKAFTGIECDVTDETSVERAFKEVVDQAGRIDALINNAGLGRFGNIENMSAADWDVQHETNLRGVFLCARAVIPVMKEQNRKENFGGHIVNIASVAGLIGNPAIGAYNATKFGVRGLSEALMKELRDDGIKVTCVYPGSIETEFFEVADADMSPNPMRAADVAATILHVLDTHDNYLVSEVMMRPLRPRG